MVGAEIRQAADTLHCFPAPTSRLNKPSEMNLTPEVKSLPLVVSLCHLNPPEAPEFKRFWPLFLPDIGTVIMSDLRHNGLHNIPKIGLAVSRLSLPSINILDL